MSLTDATLHAWMAGALEPPDALRVEEALRQDPALLSRVSVLRAELIEAPTDPWRIPPPGVPGGRVGLQLRPHQVAVFGGGLRPGDRFELRIPALLDADTRRVVVLRQHADGWQVLFPTTPEERVALAELPLADGEHVLEVSAGPQAGTQRWAVALPPLSTAIDWAADELTRWRDTLKAIAAGEVPCASAEVLVG